jgi:hypothetical protein
MSIVSMSVEHKPLNCILEHIFLHLWRHFCNIQHYISPKV